MSKLTPRSLFRATALHGRDDFWAADGIHLRIFVSPQMGVPIHPFVAWHLNNAALQEPGPLNVRWVDENNMKKDPGPFDLDGSGIAVGTVLGPAGNFSSPDWCFLRLEGSDPGLQVELLEGQVTPFGRPITAVRSRSPYAFGGAQLPALRVSGTGRVNGLSGVHEDQLFTDALDQRLIFGLPIVDSPWYIPGTDPLGDAKMRLVMGQSKRFGPPDQPDETFERMPDGDEAQNILDQLGPAHIDPWLKAAFNSDDPPATVTRPFSGQHSNQRMIANLFAWDTLLAMTVDPRIARYLGFSIVLDPSPINTGAAAWVVATQLAMPQKQVDELRQQTGIDLQPGTPSSWVNLVQSRLQELFPDAAHIHDKLKAMEWTVVTVVTLAVAVIDAPPDPPRAPMPHLGGQGQWNGSDGGAHWTQSVALLGQPPSGMASFARIAPGGVVSLHQRFPASGDAARATALLANWSYQPPKVLDGFDLNVLRGVGGALWTPPILTDGQVPVDPQGAAWLLWQADEFGRWSKEAQVSASLPERPLAPAPAPELDFQPSEADGDQPASPGMLNVRIDVPASQSLAPGALPIQAVEIAVDGAPPQSVALISGQMMVSSNVAAPALSPGASTTVTVTARFCDAEGRPVSLDGQARRSVFDPRSIVPNPTAPTILWAGRLDTTGKAELALMWKAPSLLARYRVYLGDERRLVEALHLTSADLGSTRAAWAKAIYDRAKTGQLVDKSQFTLLTEQPLLPGADGVVRFQYQLPGGLSGVQFLRIVPVTQAGVEAPFAVCGLVPVAVPFSERPNAPTLRVTPVAGGVQVEVLAYGFTLEMLARYGYPAPGRVPQYRVRRTRGLLSEAIYLPIVQQGTLNPPNPGEPDDAPWTVTFIDPDVDPSSQVFLFGQPLFGQATFALPHVKLPPYVSHTWLAEVRYPAEPAQAETLPEPSPMTVRQQWGSPNGDAESLWSALSLPAATTLVPAEPPGALVGAMAQKQPDGKVKLYIPAVPVAHPKAIGSYQLAIWKWVKVGDVDQLEDDKPDKRPTDGGTQGFEYVDDNATGNAVAYTIAAIDPLGRMGTLSRVDVIE